MLSALDRRITSVILLRVRRRWPLLSFVPERWMRPLLAPLATRLRQSLMRAAVAAAVVTGATVLVLEVLR